MDKYKYWGIENGIPTYEEVVSEVYQGWVSKYKVPIIHVEHV